MKSLLSRFGGVMGVALLSQVLSALSTLALPLLGLRTADTVALGSQIGLTGFSGVVVGIVYNLAIGRPGFRHWKLWMCLSASVPLVLATAQLTMLFTNGYFESGFVSTTVYTLSIFAIGGSMIAVAGVYGTRQACIGSPLIFAATTVLPNAGLLSGTLLGYLSGWVIAPAVGWLIGSISILARAHSIDQRTADRNEFVLPAVQGGSRMHVAGLSIGLVSSTLAPIMYLAAMTQLASGTVFFVTLIARVSNAAVTLTVNSVLMVKYNWNSSGTKDLRFAQFCAIVFVVFTLAAFALLNLVHSVWWSALLVIAGWTMFTISSASVIREINFQRRGRAILCKAIAEAPLTVTIAIILIGNPTAIGFFGAYALSQSITLLTGGLALRNRRLLFLGIPAAILSVCLVFFGWTP